MNQNSSEYYWSLVIEDGWLQAAIWTLSQEYVRVMSTGASTKWSTPDDLVTSADSALSDAVAGFPEDQTEPSKTVFGVPPMWVHEGQIMREHLDKIRQIAHKLSLSPIGFVVLPEAIAHMIRLKEGSPVSGIVVGVGESNIDVTLFRFGNLVGTVNVGRSVSIVSDLLEGLSRFNTGEGLPSRIMLYDGNNAELDGIQEELTKADWGLLGENEVKFLHSPQVEVIDPKSKTIAVCAAGASELGNVTGLLVDGEQQPKEEKIEKRVEGDVENQGNVSPAHDLSPEDVGFVVGEEVKNFASVSQHPPVGDAAPPPVASRTMPKLKFPTLPLGKLKLPIKKANDSHPSMGSVTTTPRWKRIAIIFSLLLILLVGGLGAAWWYLPKAEIVLFLAPQNLEEVELLTLDETVTEPDVEDRVFPAETVTVEVIGSKSRAATGSKTVGDQASGEVTIRNGTASDIILESGTPLTGPGDLEYSINEEVTVSAATSPSEPGSVTVAVTASEIGADYNLASGESFAVSNYPSSEVDAVSEGDITGGSSRDVVAVSSDDIEKLEIELTEELRAQGIAQIESQVEETSYFVSDAVRTESIDTSFSQNAGDEATSVDLDMTIEVIGIVVSRQQLEQLARSLLDPKVPGGYVLRSEQIEVEFVLEDEEDGAWFFEATIAANLLPEINAEEITKNISGTPRAEAQNYLTTIPGFTKADITLTPSLPGVLGTIPRVPDNITIEIIADR